MARVEMPRRSYTDHPPPRPAATRRGRASRRSRHRAFERHRREQHLEPLPIGGQPGIARRHCPVCADGELVVAGRQYVFARSQVQFVSAGFTRSPCSVRGANGFFPSANISHQSAYPPGSTLAAHYELDLHRRGGDLTGHDEPHRAWQRQKETGRASFDHDTIPNVLVQCWRDGSRRRANDLRAVNSRLCLEVSVI